MNGFSKRYFLLISAIFIVFVSLALLYDITFIWIIFAFFLAVLFAVGKAIKTKARNFNTILILLLIASVIGVGRAELLKYKNSALSDMYTGKHIVCGYVKEVSSSYPYMSESVVEIDSVDGNKASFDAVLFTDFASDLALGDRFEANVDIYLLSAYEDKDYLRNKDSADLTLICVPLLETDILRVGEESSLSIKFLELNSRLSAKLKASLGTKNGALAGALLLGNRELLHDSTLRDFKRSGVYHMLALSGLHVAILIGILDYILKRMRTNLYIRIVVLSLSSVFYVALTGFKLSAIRAMLMLLIMYVSMLLRARRDSMTALFFAVSLVVFISPLSVFDLGLQLSFLSTFGVIAANIIISQITFLNRKLSCEKAKERAITIARYFIKLIIASICVFVVTLPLLMKYFGEVSLATFFSNLFMGAVCEIFMIFALFSLLFSNIFLLGGVFSYIATVSGNVMTLITEEISKVEGVMLSLKYPNMEYIVWGAFILALVLFAVKLKRKWLISLPCVMLAFLIFVNVYSYSVSRDGFVRAEYSVGDVMVLTSGEEVFICDASSGRYGTLYDGVMLAKDNCFTEIDGVVLTHYHSYHITSLNRLADEFVVKSVYAPSPQNEDEAMIFSAIYNALEDTETEMYVYDAEKPFVALGGELVASKRYYSASYSHPSIVLTYCYGNSRITLIEKPYFDTFLESGGAFKNYIKESDMIIFGSDGRSIENRFEIFSSLKKGANINFTDIETMLLSDYESYIEDFSIYVDVEYKKYDLK